jgi:hypothetical protein
VVAGGLGVRVAGALVLGRRARVDRSGLAGWLALSVLGALVLGFLVVGDPLALNGAQFLILPQLLLWTTTGPWLAGWLEVGGARRWAGLALVAASCASPLLYVARKAWPESLTRRVRSTGCASRSLRTPSPRHAGSPVSATRGAPSWPPTGAAGRAIPAAGRRCTWR